MEHLHGVWKISSKERNDLLDYHPPSLTNLMEVKLPIIENYSCPFPLPMGFSLYLQVNGQMFSVPMVTEEASIIAASCKANKFILQHSGGYDCQYLSDDDEGSVAEGQIYLECTDLNNLISKENLTKILQENQKSIQECADFCCPSLKKRGFGNVTISPDDSHLPLAPDQRVQILSLKLNVGDQLMGANCVNTVAEGIAPLLEKITKSRVKFCIVTNFHPPTRIVKAKFKVPAESLSESEFNSGLEIAKSIVKLNEWAKADIKRATTHNKGIFNGIDAVAIATGQDWRAIEAAGHSYACYKSKSYAPLTEYELINENDQKIYLQGSIQIPMPVGVSGYGIESNEMASYNLKWMKITKSSELAFLIASIGLGQNFSALRAIATHGIQKGHMRLHLKNKNLQNNENSKLMCS